MNKPQNIFLWLPLIALLLLGSCKKWASSGDESPVVASYKNTELTRRELAYYLPAGVGPKDSARYAKFYIDQWVKEKAMADEALQTIDNLEDKINFKVEDYRQKLILHEYTTYLIQNQLDTNISTEEMKLYYEREKDKYLAKEDLYSFWYIATSKTEVNGVGGWVESADSGETVKLKEWATENALQFKIDSSFRSVNELNQIQKGFYGNLKTAPYGKLIRWSGVIQGQDRKYFFKMLSVVKKDEPMPLIMIKSRLQSNLLNERKIKLIEENEESILKKANSGNHIKTNY